MAALSQVAPSPPHPPTRRLLQIHPKLIYPNSNPILRPHPESLIRESPDPPKPEENSPNEKLSDDSAKEGIGGDGLGEEEEEGECGFCLFMKAGVCRETFTDWEKCVEEGEKNKEDIVEKCVQATSALRKCMEAHSDYYAPLLDAEEAVMKQLEEEEKSDDADKKESP